MGKVGTANDRPREERSPGAAVSAFSAALFVRRRARSPGRAQPALRRIADVPFRSGGPSAGISQMRTGDLQDRLVQLIPRRIGIDPMTPNKKIPVQVTPGVARDPRNDCTRPFPSPGFGPSGRTVPVQIPTASSLNIFSPAQLAPGTSRSRSIRSKIAAKSVRGTSTSAGWPAHVGVGLFADRARPSPGDRPAHDDVGRPPGLNLHLPLEPRIVLQQSSRVPKLGLGSGFSKTPGPSAGAPKARARISSDRGDS
jgi:hypothetical protein